MSKAKPAQPWIKPKLNRPSLSPDYFPRRQLLSELNAKRGCPLAVIVGPAGYGKTTLLVSWLNNLEWPSVWVSLDASDNSLYVFVQYIVAAIQKQFPAALETTKGLLQSVALPDAMILTRALINDLDEIDTPFVLALDDYHLIREPAIHGLVREMLRYPSSNFHLAISTRHDPLLPLSTMRAKGLMAEVRIENLRFTDEESATLLRKVTGMDLGASSISMIAEQLDGWAAGLYVAGLTLRRKPAMLTMKPGMVTAASEAIAYLFDDVLLQQPPQVQEFLLRTSILEELNHSLCKAVAGDSCATYEGQDSLDFLVERNLFLSQIVGQERAYRYHHLFQSLLRTELKRRYSDAECEVLNRRASEWYALKGNPEEALRYALRLRDADLAVQVVCRFRIEVMNEDDWQRLEYWLSLLPRAAVNASADLQVLEAYLSQVRFRIAECAERLPIADRLISEMAPSPEKDALRGEIDALRAWFVYVTAGDPSVMHQLSEKSLRLTPQNRWQARTFAWLFYSASHLFRGQVARGLELMDSAFDEQEAQKPGYKLRLITVLSLAHDHVGHLSNMQRFAQEGHRISGVEKSAPDRWPLHTNWVRFLLSCVHYHRNELAEAEALLKLIIEQRYQSQVNCVIQSAFCLALIYQAQGRPDEANKLTEFASQYALEMRSTILMPAILLFEVQLALHRGQIADAAQRLKHRTLPEKLPYSIFIYNPYATMVKVHLALGTPDHLSQAEGILTKLHQHAETVHNTPQQLESLALKALLADARQDQRAAFMHLEQALLMAQPEGYVRIFADLGVRMSDLLTRFHSRRVSPKYVRRIISAIPKDATAEAYPTQAGLLEPLTDRELEVLSLLMKRMSNKEIADALFISPGTVKHHTHVIFEKLEVHSRREAVLKAMDLNLLGQP